jgi:L-arabinose 1-dehydrogenase [NAD(P)+]
MYTRLCRVAVVIVPFTFDVPDYQPWAGTAGAGDTALFAEAVDRTEEVAVARLAGRAVRKPQLLDLGEPIQGAFAGLDVVVHLAATIHADAAWPTVSRNNIDATHNVLEECVRSSVRRFVFASSNHTQAADFFTSLDPATPGGMCTLRSPDLHATQPLTTLTTPAAPDGFYALSKLLGEEMCKFFSCRHGLETVCLRIGWFKGGHLASEEAQLAELAELKDGPAQDYMRAMWLSREDALQTFRAACTTENLPAAWPASSTGPFGVAYAVSNNTRRLFDLEESVKLLGYSPRDDYDTFAATLCD